MSALAQTTSPAFRSRFLQDGSSDAAAATVCQYRYLPAPYAFYLMLLARILYSMPTIIPHPYSFAAITRPTTLRCAALHSSVSGPPFLQRRSLSTLLQVTP